MIPYLNAKLGAREERGWGLPTGVRKNKENSAGAIDLQEYSMLCDWVRKETLPGLGREESLCFTSGDALEPNSGRFFVVEIPLTPLLPLLSSLSRNTESKSSV
jgi:hypothetical protein